MGYLLFFASLVFDFNLLLSITMTGAAGQRCMALTTLVCVGETEKWLDALVEHAKTFQVGPGWQQGVDVGPLISKAAKERVHHILDQAVSQGAEILLDGRNVAVSDFPDGNFVGPTIVRVLDTSNAAYTQEIFGPVLTVLSVSTLQEAMDLINANPYGNGVALFTSSGAAARKFTNEIQAGQGRCCCAFKRMLVLFTCRLGNFALTNQVASF